MAKQVFVTDGTGFVGSNLVDDLLKNDYQVVENDNFHPLYYQQQKMSNGSG